MTARQTFTFLCQQMGSFQKTSRVDLHIHTTFSDGAYTPAEVVDLARRSGLSALAITDHDTIEGIRPAQQAAGTALEVIPGVELSAHYRNQSIHVLGYFFALEDPCLTRALEELRHFRAQRFRSMVERLEQQGIHLDCRELEGEKEAGTLGRRHLAELLVKAGRARTLREAFARYLADHRFHHLPHYGLPVQKALEFIRGAGGVACWAHPPLTCTRENLQELRDLGLQGVEADYPGCSRGRSRQLRTWAQELDLGISGGSDCHGPGNGPRDIGAGGITREELERLRQRASL